MNGFTVLVGAAVPMFEANIDTDQLCPRQYLTAIRRVGFGRALFSDRRWKADGSPVADFILNLPPFAAAAILVAGDNFGCGSSREHAVWALSDAGIRCVIAPSFGDIFLQNTVNSGVLAIRLPAAKVQELAGIAASQPGEPWTVDLPAQTIAASTGIKVSFEIEPARKERLVRGLDEIDMTLRFRAELESFQARQRVSEPWLWTGG